jgi:hypothetical protein
MALRRFSISAQSISRVGDRGAIASIPPDNGSTIQQSFDSTRIMANVDVAMIESSGRRAELSFPLPKSPDTRIYLQLTIQTTSLLLFLTTAMNGDTSTTAPLGSFVYALPDVTHLSILSFENFALTASIENESGPNHFNPSLHL